MEIYKILNIAQNNIYHMLTNIEHTTCYYIKQCPTKATLQHYLHYEWISKHHPNYFQVFLQKKLPQ